jgi:hypothetical protein
MNTDLFVISKERKEIALLKGVGRFCKCGCGKPLKGKLVTRLYYGKPIQYYLPVKKDQVFATIHCQHKYHNSINSYPCTTHLLARIQVKPENNSRLVTIYYNHKRGIRVMITKNDKAIWSLMNKIEKEIGGIID